MQLQPREALPKIMLARYYSDSLGRFASADPQDRPERNLWNPQKWNRYAYVLNNPLNLWDPDGREEQPPPASQTDNALKTGWNAIQKAFRFKGPKGLEEAAKGATPANKGVAIGAAKNARDAAIQECADTGNGCDAADKLTELVQGSDSDKGINEIIKYFYEKSDTKDEEEKKADEEEKKSDDKEDSEDGKENSYGFDPDGSGPMPHPCQGMGPMCR